jgi:hypothetical protein
MPHWRIKLMIQMTASGEDLEHVFDKFPKYCMKMFRDFSAKVGRKIFSN